MTTAAVYLRISQDRDGTMLGVDRQREDCLATCKKNRWKVGEVFVDDDTSAYSRRKVRHGYRAMLEALKAGTVDGVVAWHPDRLHRSTVELEEFIDLVETTGAQVVTVQAGVLDLATPTGRMTARIVGAVARHESEHKAERIRRQREQAARAGSFHGGRRPFGYARDGVTVVGVEADLIRDAAARVLGGESIRRIADDWNERKIPTTSGGTWQITSIRSMLAGPRLAGLRVHRGDVVGDAEWPAILDRTTFEKVCLILGDPRRRQGGATPVHLLSSLLRCGRCGGVMHASRRTDGARRYICNRKPGEDRCGRVAVTAEPVERLVTEAVLYAIESPAVNKAMRRKPTKIGPDHAGIISACEQQLDELAADYGAGTIQRREWLNARGSIEKRLNEARRHLARDEGTEALAPLRDVDPRAAWDGLDLEHRRAVIAALVDRVVIRPSTGPVFEASRVDVVWKA